MNRMIWSYPYEGSTSVFTFLLKYHELKKPQTSRPPIQRFHFSRNFQTEFFCATNQIARGNPSSQNKSDQIDVKNQCGT